jgi:hypothetical protein
MPRIRALLRAAAIALLLVVSITSPASAHERRQYLPDGRGFGGIQSDHHTIYACDTKADNWGVRTWAYFRGSGATLLVGDANGSKEGCGRQYFSTQPSSFQVCAGPYGADYVCTGWWSVF